MNYTQCVRVPKQNLYSSGLGAYAQLQQKQYQMEFCAEKTNNKKRIFAQNFYYPSQVSNSYFQPEQEPSYYDRRECDSRQNMAKMPSYFYNPLSGNLS